MTTDMLRAASGVGSLPYLCRVESCAWTACCSCRLLLLLPQREVQHWLCGVLVPELLQDIVRDASPPAQVISQQLQACVMTGTAQHSTTRRSITSKGNSKTAAPVLHSACRTGVHCLCLRRVCLAGRNWQGQAEGQRLTLHHVTLLCPPAHSVNC